MTEQNTELQQAWDFVENTGVSIFLTGKAGTGKTTFLRSLQQRSPKRMVVVAPTGVAAINAGGMTIHSFFQLPLSPYVPEASYKQRYDFSAEKRSLIRTLDLLVIDEVSMVRADLLDAVDNVMRRFRNPRRPFGGVQLLLIGDLQQLTPVVTPEEETLIGKYYDTPYFFGSKALQQTRYVTLELRHVFRQQDATFLNVLNHIRENRPTDYDLALLNSRCQPSFQPAPDAGYIRLTTHNRLADAYNEDALRRLPGRTATFQATVDGTFPELAYPTDPALRLKTGAQVMFVKNDSGADHRYYNGRIGRVTQMSDTSISVRCPGDDDDIVVSPAEWENSKYELNPDTKEIETRVVGTFRQFPLRLAWAITIHKSQGLTFERAIIDAGQAFAAGQVYVALSRCKSLEGLVLASPLRAAAIFGDQRVAHYIAQEEAEATRSIAELPALKVEFHRQQLRELFCFDALLQGHDALLRQLDEHFYHSYPRLCSAHRTAREELRQKVAEVSRKWCARFPQMTAAQLSDEAFLQRVSRGAVYFLNTLTDLLGTLLEKTDVDTDNRQARRRMTTVMQELRQTYQAKTAMLAAVAREGFAPTTYLRLRQKALLQALEQPAAKPTRKTATRKAGKTATATTPAPTPAAPPSTSDIGDKALYERLRDWRWEKAKQLGLPPYTILQQKALIAMTNARPADMAALTAIPYFGKASAEKYGAEILRVIRA